MSIRTLDRITVYPVKSLDGVAVMEAGLLRGAGLEHDRRWQLVDLEGRAVNAKRTALLHAIRAEYGIEGLATAEQGVGLQAAGPQVQGDIRAKVDSESHLDRSPSALVDRLMFWRTPPNEGGLQVDPRREAQRLRENAALGQNVAEGDSRIIQPRSRGLIDRIFR